MESFFFLFTLSHTDSAPLTFKIDSLGADCKMTSLLQRALDEAARKKDVKDEIGPLVTSQRGLSTNGGLSMTRKVYTPYKDMQRPKSSQTANGGPHRASSRQPFIYPVEHSAESFV